MGRAGLLPQPGPSGPSDFDVSGKFYLLVERSGEEAPPEPSRVLAGGRMSQNAGG